MEKVLIRLKGVRDILQTMACGKEAESGYAFFLLADLLDECIEAIEEEIFREQ